MAHLADDDLQEARRALPSLCGRDPSHLDAAEITRAVIESVAENTSDSVTNEYTPVKTGSQRVQVTPSGGLIVLHVDHQSTGGYPVIATVIRADLPLLAQARPGDTVRFRQVDQAEAARAHRRMSGWLELDL